MAQSTTWSLPPGAQENQGPARAQGPVDAQIPAVRPQETEAPASPPTAAPSPRPTPVPTIVAPPPPPQDAPARAQPRPAASNTAAPNTQAPAAAEHPAQAPHNAETAAPVPTPAATAETQPAPVTAASGVPQAAPSVAPEQTGEPAPVPHWPEWWLAIPVALVAAAGGVVVMLRRRRPPATAWEEAGLEPEAEPEDEIPEQAAGLSASAAVAALDPVLPVPAAASAASHVQPLPGPATANTGGISVTLEATALRLSLVYATLQYRLTLTAAESGTPEAWRISGDMISAHASLSQAEQLAPDPADLPLRHSVDALAPGEVRELKGELQLPLNAIRVMKQGQFSLFVPLVRLCLTDGHGRLERRVFTLGVPGDGPGLAPIRLDTGPRDHAAIGAREVEAARAMGFQPVDSLPLDPRRAAG